MRRAKKSLGQNFLVDPNLQAKIADAVDPRPDDEILEIGPGRGALTRHLAGRVRRLVAVELDRELADALRGDLQSIPGVTVVHADILKTRLDAMTGNPAAAKVIGNIPYNITTPLIFWLLDQRPRPALAVLMVQREVADRILAGPGEKTYGALSVGVRIAAHVERLFHVGRNAFRPVPDVDSTVIRLVPHSPPLLDPREERDVRALTRAAFGRRRKQLQKILRSAPEFGLEPAELDRITVITGIALDRRPETLDPLQFIALARMLRSLGYPRDTQPQP